MGFTLGNGLVRPKERVSPPSWGIVTYLYLGTKSTHLRSDIWKHMYHRSDGNGLQFYKSNTITRDHRTLSGSIDTRPIEDSLIVLPNVAFTDRMRLTRDTPQILRTLPFKHHVYLKTWTTP